MTIFRQNSASRDEDFLKEIRRMAEEQADRDVAEVKRLIERSKAEDNGQLYQLGLQPKQSK